MCRMRRWSVLAHVAWLLLLWQHVGPPTQVEYQPNKLLLVLHHDPAQVPMLPPTAEQEVLLLKLVTAAFIDHVGRKKALSPGAFHHPFHGAAYIPCRPVRRLCPRPPIHARRCLLIHIQLLRPVNRSRELDDGADAEDEDEIDEREKRVLRVHRQSSLHAMYTDSPPEWSVLLYFSSRQIDNYDRSRFCSTLIVRLCSTRYTPQAGVR